MFQRLYDVVVLLLLIQPGCGKLESDIIVLHMSYQ
jgi:hypothetical protein